VDTLLHAAVANALTATLLALPVALAARLSRRPALAHALWLLVLLKLITPPLFPVRLPWADPLANAPVAGQAPVATASRLLPVVLGRPVAHLPDGEELLHQGEALRVRHEPPAPWPMQQGDGWRNVLLAVWLAGSGLWWALALARVAHFRSVLRQARAASPELQAHVHALAGLLGLSRCPRIGMLPARVSPLLWAVGWTPRLLLPADLWESLTPDQRDALLAHELAHLRRRDHWVRRLELLVLGLFWWHPVAWWARHELAEAEEACCDAWVVWALPEAGPAYAAALVATAAYLSEARRPVPVAASGAGRVQSLKRRLIMILQGPSPRALSGTGLLTVLALGVLLLPLLPTWADQQPDQPRAETGPVAPSAVPVAGPKGAAPAERLRFETEELETQLAIRRAQLQAARTILEHVTQRCKRAVALFEKGAISRVEVAQTRGWLEQAKGDVLAGEASLREAEARLEESCRRLAALQAPAGEAGKDTATGDGWAERLFETRMLDVSVQEGGRVTDRINLVNRTKEPVRISSVRTSSAALTATPNATTLAPGSRSFIQFTVDGKRFIGAKVFTLYVTFDRPAAAEVRVQVRAVIAGSGGRPEPEARRDSKEASDRERLQRLERQLEILRKEVESLRKTLPQRPPAGDLPAGNAPLQYNERNLNIPLPERRGEGLR
jgi:beta-lactamase regulating signal transducer with metallopeptidase domain